MKIIAGAFAHVCSEACSSQAPLRPGAGGTAITIAGTTITVGTTMAGVTGTGIVEVVYASEPETAEADR